MTSSRWSTASPDAQMHQDRNTEQGCWSADYRLEGRNRCCTGFFPVLLEHLHQTTATWPCPLQENILLSVKGRCSESGTEQNWKPLTRQGSSTVWGWFSHLLYHIERGAASATSALARQQMKIAPTPMSLEPGVLSICRRDKEPDNSRTGQVKFYCIFRLKMEFDNVTGKNQIMKWWDVHIYPLRTAYIPGCYFV